jgi:membrane protease YdiL (CAAX protease family)
MCGAGSQVMMNQLVERYGRIGFAAISSVIWALPMAAWAGSSDLSPMDKTAYPWIALAVGLVMLGVWIYLLTRLGRIAVSARQRRFDLSQMSALEKRWTLGCGAFITGLIAWLNAGATVDWGPLGAAIGKGETGPSLFAAALAVYLFVMVAGIAWTARGANRAYAQRLISSSRPAGAPGTP